MAPQQQGSSQTWGHGEAEAAGKPGQLRSTKHDKDLFALFNTTEG